MKYTPDEIAALLANRTNQHHYVKALIEKCVREAVMEEREECARACVDVYYRHIGPKFGEVRYGVAACEKAIRARSNK